MTFIPLVATPTSHIPYFDAPHLVVLALVFLVPAALVQLVKDKDFVGMPRKVGMSLVIILLVNEIAYRIFYFNEAESIHEFLEFALPIHLCPLALFSGMIALWRHSQICYEFSYFVGLTGTVNALLTPDIIWPFPSFGFIGYFMSHCGVLWVVLYATWALEMRPNWRSMWRVFLLLNGIAVVLALVNLALGGEANYAFLCKPPEADTPFFFAPWPWYILFLEIIALGMFFLAYMPFYICDKVRNLRTDLSSN